MFAPAAEPLDPTRTPIPTFTPTQASPTIDAVATQVSEAPVAVATEIAGAPSGDQAAAPTAAQEAVPPTDTPPAEPTATPTPERAIAVAAQGMNVRSGPGTNYAVIGAAQAGDQFMITGKDNSGAWWEVDFNGRAGWLFAQLVTANNSSGVQVAQNIPTPPPATATPVPQPTQPPPPTAAPAQPAQPTQPPPPANNYKFNIVVVSKCDRQPAGNWFEGKTYVNGQPASGYKVVFSYAPDAPPITAPVVSGPHPGYEGWDAGYYSHIINASGPKAGNWYVWVVDDSGNRISEIGNWTSTGPGEGCNQAVVDFDSR
jgi:uncharacterized protein YraI